MPLDGIDQQILDAVSIHVDGHPLAKQAKPFASPEMPFQLLLKRLRVKALHVHIAPLLRDFGCSWRTLPRSTAHFNAINVGAVRDKEFVRYHPDFVTKFGPFLGRFSMNFLKQLGHRLEGIHPGFVRPAQILQHIQMANNTNRELLAVFAAYQLDFANAFVVGWQQRVLGGHLRVNLGSFFLRQGWIGQEMFHEFIQCTGMAGHHEVAEGNNAAFVLHKSAHG